MDAERNLYAPRSGHGDDLHTPDVIQRRPELYSRYVDELTGVLGSIRGLSENQLDSLRSQIRKDLAPILKEAPTSGKPGALKSDSMLEREAQKFLRSLLVQDFQDRRKAGTAVSDLTYHPELSGPGLLDVFPTTTADLADSMFADFISKRPGDQFSNRISKEESHGFGRDVRTETAQIEPSVQAAIGLLQQSRDIECANRAQTVVESPGGGAKFGGCN